MIEKTFRTSELGLNYAEGPQNGPTMVLLHGQSSVWQDWMPVITAFESDWHILAPDLRGCGGSGWSPEGNYGNADYAADIIEFIDNKTQGPIVLVGHSRGSLVTLHIAARDNKKRIRGIVIEDPPMYLAQFYKQWAWYDYYHVSAEVLRAGLNEEQITKVFAEKLALSEADAAKEARSLVQMDPKIIYRVMEGEFLRGLDPEAELKRVTCPLLLLYGEWDLGSVLRPQDIERLSKLLPPDSLQQISGVGHSLHFANCKPDQFNTALAGFLDRLPAD